jgi:ribosomal protein S18 acetylase RimI-like enzyme
VELQDTVVGYAQVWAEDSAHRIATAMLRESFAEFRRRGQSRVRLNVDSDNLTGAVSVYERVGMRVASSYDLSASSAARAPESHERRATASSSEVASTCPAATS